MRWGIAGPGRMGRRFADALAETPSAELVAVAGRTHERARAIATDRDVASYDDYAAFVADERIEIVYVSTTNNMHSEHARLALEAGKHVLVEKPMALALDDARQLEAEARERELLLGVGFQLRHHPVNVELVRRLRSGEAGEPLHVEALWGVGAPVPRDIWQMDPAIAGLGSLGGLGVHLIDLVPWIVGDEVTEVVAMDDAAWEEHPVEFLTTALLRFRNGCFAHLTSSRRLPHATNSVVVHASECRLEARGTLAMDGAGSLAIVREGREEIHDIPIGNIYHREIEAFEGAIHGGPSFHASARDGVRSVALTEAIVEAARTGRTLPVETDVRTPSGSER